MHQKQTPNVAGKIDCCHSFHLSIWFGTVFHFICPCFSISLVCSFVRSAFSRENFSTDFFPFRVKNRLRWIPLLLLYLFQFLSHFYFYFDLMMLYFRSVCFVQLKWQSKQSVYINLIQRLLYVQCARITIERVCLCLCGVELRFRISNCLQFQSAHR